MHAQPMGFQQQAEEALNELVTLQDLIRWAVSRMAEQEVFHGHGSDNPWDEALYLVAHALNLSWQLAQEWQQSRTTRSERQIVMAFLEQRLVHKVPTPYLTGEAWFCGQPYLVDERVLIPRSPIGELINQRFSPWWPEDKEPARIMDLCTGSGCIGIACAYEFESAQVELLDISFDALEVAEENIANHHMDDRVMALQSDLFAAASGKYDIIVSNPPYVDAEDMASLPEEYQHEPELALAAGDDGLDLVHIMLAQAAEYLTDDGIFILEVGNSFPALQEAYPELPFEWPDFEFGGHGVCVLRAADLKAISAK